MINKCILIGDIWKLPEEKYINNNENLRICTLFLVTKEYHLDRSKNTEEEKVYIEHKEWHQVTIFNRNAEYVMKNIKIGDIVYLEGQIQTRIIAPKEGTDEKKKYIKEIIVKDRGIIKKIYSKKPVMNNSSSNNNEEEDNFELEEEVVF
ncbi:hypothetical protein AB836_01260 [Rickettsiales bacterium (ex Bugula neritina AB1)]|nr:hypothetical protein AB836_01260 [Rickettsiales bacterium (ex Bugula neritina AB1)]